MKNILNKNEIGIIGGGQLARMLATESYQKNFKVNILTSSKHDPAAQISANYTLGKTTDKKDLIRFCKKNTIVTFESEFIDTDQLKTVKGVKFHPSLKNIKIIQDRYTQKKLLTKHNIATSNYLHIKDYQDAVYAFIYFNSKKLVYKKSRNGYDGYGTLIANSLDELSKNKGFFSEYCIAEEFVKFKRELALTFCRNTKGKIITFPLVQSFQKENKCYWVNGPINKKLDALKKDLKNLLNSLNYIGSITFELFDLGNHVLINEIAPRVHNTAHHTLDSTNISQFEAHLLAIQGFDLPEVKLINKGFSMINLISSGVKNVNIPDLDARVYWYGKDKNRKGRKMGHVNFLAKNKKEALKYALSYIKKVKI